MKNLIIEFNNKHGSKYGIIDTDLTICGIYKAYSTIKTICKIIPDDDLLIKLDKIKLPLPTNPIETVEYTKVKHTSYATEEYLDSQFSRLNIKDSYVRLVDLKTLAKTQDIVNLQNDINKLAEDITSMHKHDNMEALNAITRSKLEEFENKAEVDSWLDDLDRLSDNLKTYVDNKKLQDFINEPIDSVNSYVKVGDISELGLIKREDLNDLYDELGNKVEKDDNSSMVDNELIELLKEFKDNYKDISLVQLLKSYKESLTLALSEIKKLQDELKKYTPTEEMDSRYAKLYHAHDWEVDEDASVDHEYNGILNKPIVDGNVVVATQDWVKIYVNKFKPSTGDEDITSESLTIPEEYIIDNGEDSESLIIDEKYIIFDDESESIFIGGNI